MLTTKLLAAAAIALLSGVQPAQDDARVPGLLLPFDAVTYLTGRFEPDTSRAFALLPAEVAGTRQIWLRKEAARALIRMTAAARDEGIALNVLSGTRSYAGQKAIWEAKFSGRRTSAGRNLARDFPDTRQRVEAILRYSSAPGTSRHHWGTDIDLNSTTMSWWATRDGMQALTWLHRRGGEFGFELPYTSHREHGYRYEPWHWSYAPLARPLLVQHYLKMITTQDLGDFLGAGHFQQLPWMKWYVEGVAEVLK